MQHTYWVSGRIGYLQLFATRNKKKSDKKNNKNENKDQNKKSKNDKNKYYNKKN